MYACMYVCIHACLDVGLNSSSPIMRYMEPQGKGTKPSRDHKSLFGPQTSWESVECHGKLAPQKAVATSEWGGVHGERPEGFLW